MLSVIIISHYSIWKILWERRLCSWSSVPVFKAPFFPELPHEADSRFRPLLHMDASPGLPRLAPTELPESLSTFLLLPSPPRMDQAGKQEARMAQGRRFLCPCRPPSFQERPHHVAAHESHRDPGLWPCLLLTQRFPIIWGKQEGDHSPPQPGLTLGLRRGRREEAAAAPWRTGFSPEGETRAPPRPCSGPSCWTSAGISLSLALSVWGLTEFHSETGLSRSVKQDWELHRPHKAVVRTTWITAPGA